MRYPRFSPRTKTSAVLSMCLALTASSTLVRAGQEIDDKAGKEMTTAAEPQYEGGRGLLTLQGPSGMFINPTSGTLPQGKFTLQYCNLYQDNHTDVVVHGWMASYGVTDWLEIGGIADVANVPGGINLGVGGPLVRVRLLRDREWWPQLSVGFYGKYGTNVLEQSTAFLAAYKRIPIDESGFFKSLGFHAGVRGSWYHEGFAKDESVNVYGGAELQLPYRLYLVGEVGTKGNTPAGRDPNTPYAFGAQWRLGAVNVTFAGVQDGTMDKISLFYGVGTAIPF